MTRIPFVDLYAQYQTYKAEIDSAIAGVISSSAYIRGPYVDRFEKAWAETLGVKHCISCASGTDALFLAMKALGTKAGDEVITTAHSWISTSETVTLAGGRVVFCDTEEQTFTINVKLIEEKITPNTRGIIPVHLFGQPADMDPIIEIARKHNLWVIEDCAQAHLATYKGRFVGTFGNAAIFSFYPGKNLGAYGDAGCVVTDDDRMAEWLATYSRHGGKGVHIMEGVNSRLDGLQAAVLLAKLPHLKEWTIARQRIAARYDTLLDGVGDLITPKIGQDREHVYHLYVIRTESRDLLRQNLSGAGIETVINYPRALPFYPAYSYLKHKPGEFPAAYSNQSQILSLPIYPEMSDQMVRHVAESIRGFFGDPHRSARK